MSDLFRSSMPRSQILSSAANADQTPFAMPSDMQPNVSNNATLCYKYIENAALCR